MASRRLSKLREAQELKIDFLPLSQGGFYLEKQSNSLWKTDLLCKGELRCPILVLYLLLKQRKKMSRRLRFTFQSLLSR